MGYNISAIDIANFSPYLICFFISSLIAFVDILEDYSVFEIRRGFLYKITFSLFNGLVGSFVLFLLWNQVFVYTSPNLKGVLVGIFYPTIMKSKLVLHDKKSPSESISLDKLYNKFIKIFHQLIDDNHRQFTTKAKREIAAKYDIDALYKIAKDAIEDDPGLKREEYKKIKNERLEGIEEIKNDTSPDIIKREAMAKFMINNYPSDVPKLSSSDQTDFRMIKTN